jgi:hypothetical protein
MEYNGKDRLEEMLDFHGPSQLLEMLAEICIEKSIHVQQNWQDRELSLAWEKLGQRIDRLEISVENSKVYSRLP